MEADKQTMEIQQQQQQVSSATCTPIRSNDENLPNEQEQQQLHNQSSSSSSTLSNSSTITNSSRKSSGAQSSSASKKGKSTAAKSKSNTYNSPNNERHNLNKSKEDEKNGGNKQKKLDGSSTKAKNGFSNTGPKKQNLNHLLNFTYESTRESADNYYDYERFTKQFWSMKLSKNSYFSKEQFLQANCQFVVKNDGDYSVHMVDPDRLVDWSKIEEIHIETLEPLSCPICLYEPVAGKMTKCGHVYCWSCILHYLSLSDKTWRKCPICYESIYKNDLKSVKVIKHAREYRVGDEITLNLMFKSKSKYNTLIMPADLCETLNADERANKAITYELFNSNRYAECRPYLKLHSKSSDEIYEQVIRREQQELDKQYAQEKDQPEACFIKEALNLLEEREIKLKSEINSRKSTSSVVDADTTSAAAEPSTQVVSQSVQQPEKCYDDAFDDKLSENTQNCEPSKDLPQTDFEAQVDGTMNHQKEPEVEIETKKTREDRSSESPSQIQSQEKTASNDFVYFYQSNDGQRIFICGLNNRCLTSEYSSMNKCPNVIRAKIISNDSLFMTEENRKRFKYLSHLPLHSEFKIVELDLNDENYLSSKTVSLFRDELDERRRLREKKIIREKRESDRAAAAAAAADYITPQFSYVPSAMTDTGLFLRSPNLNVDNFVDYQSEFPEASSSPPVSTGGSMGDTSSSLSTISTNSSSGLPSSVDPQQQQQVSFAQMLKHSNSDVYTIREASKVAWPSLDSSTNSSATNTSSQLTSGWVNMAKQQQQQASMLGRSKRYQNPPMPWLNAAQASSLVKVDDETVETDSMPAPSYKQSFFSSIDESLRLIESKKEVESQNSKMGNDNQEKGTSQKKKKKTKQLLFSTSGF